MNEKEKAASATNPLVPQHKDTDNQLIIQTDIEDMPDFGSMADTGGFNPLADLQQNTVDDSMVVGGLTVKRGNRAMQDGAQKKDQEDFYHGLIYESEVCCGFGDSGVGKSIFAVQMGEDVARRYPNINVLHADFELSEKQFQMRFTDPDTGRMHNFPPNFFRAEINPDAAADVDDDSDDRIFTDIENAALACGAKFVIIDNLTYLCNDSEKGDAATTIMKKLIGLKRKYGWTMLVLAHRPKVDLYSPITQNHLAGSKKLMNLFDSAFAIGQSATDKAIKYIKQVKVRSAEYRYTSDHVAVFELERRAELLQFTFRGYSAEKEHLKNPNLADADELSSTVAELHRQGKTIRQIADIVNVSKSKVGRIVKDAGDPETDSENGNTSTSKDDELF